MGDVTKIVWKMLLNIDQLTEHCLIFIVLAELSHINYASKSSGLFSYFT